MRVNIPRNLKAKLKPTVKAFIEGSQFYEKQKDFLGAVPSPFTSYSLDSEDVGSWDAEDVLSDDFKLTLLETVMNTYANGLQEFVCAPNSNGKRSMNVAARNMQEMIGGSEHCPGRKLAQGLANLQEMSFLSTPAAFYGNHPQITKYDALKPFGKASVVVAVIAIHNIDMKEVIHNNNIPEDEEQADDSVVLQKNNQTTLVFCPVHPYRSNATGPEKASTLGLLQTQMGNIKEAFAIYANSKKDTLQHDTKNILCTNDIDTAITFFTGKDADYKITDTIKRTQTKKRRTSS
jgi:hypothetical protein